MKSNHQRILFISSNHWGWGGSELLWSRTAVHLAKSGWPIDVIVPYSVTTPEIESLRKMADSLQIFSGWPVGMVERILKVLGQLPTREELIKSKTPSLVVISQGGSWDGLDWAEACLNCQIPFVLVCQAVREYAWPSDDEADRIIHAFSQARKFYFISDKNRIEFEKQIGARLSNAELIRNPFNVSFDFVAPWPNSGSEANFATVARLIPGDKGQDILFEVLSDPAWIRRDYRLSLVGEGCCRRVLERLAQLYGIEKRVQFVGQVSNLTEVWKTNHALLLPSRSEGLSLALVESMLSGRFAVSTNVGDTASLVKDGVTGFIADAPTVNDFGAAMERMWQAKTNWEKIATNARELVVRTFPRDPAAEFGKRIIEQLPSLVESAA